MPVLLVNSQKRLGELVVASLRNLASFLVELQLLSSKAARLPAVRSSGKNWLRNEQRWPGAVCVCVGRGAGGVWALRSDPPAYSGNFRTAGCSFHVL